MAWSGERFSDFGSVTRNAGSSHVQPSYSRQSQPQSGSSITMLENLNTDSIANVLGTVITKESPRSIFTKKNPGSERFLMGFVVRDSPSCFVNCTCWGSEQYIKDLSKSFSIGDVVQISNAQVHSNPTDGSDEKFRVSTPLPFNLTLSENHSSVSVYAGGDVGMYASLLNIPTKATGDYYTLEEVLDNDKNLEGQHISLLTAVRKVGPLKEINTKTGKQTKRCEVKLFDETCSNFPLILWGEDLVDYAQTWLPLETVMFIADVRMKYDDFRAGMIATADSKTVITVNPTTMDARNLYQFAASQSFAQEDDSNGKGQVDPPLDQITNMITVDQVSSKEGGMVDYAVLYGVITKFDLDSDNTDQFLKRRCFKCKQLVTVDTGYQCTNPECTQGALSMFNTTGEVTVGEPDVDFSIPISISDHTGTLQTRLTGAVIETMTGWPVKELVLLEVDQRTDIKWTYLLERCKFHIKMSKGFKEPERLFVKVLSCSRADAADMAHNWSAVQGR